MYCAILFMVSIFGNCAQRIRVTEGKEHKEVLTVKGSRRSPNKSGLHVNNLGETMIIRAYMHFIPIRMVT